MIKAFSSAACVAVFALAAPALAQPASSTQPAKPSATAPAKTPATPSTGATPATPAIPGETSATPATPATPAASGIDASATSAASIASGMSVKDNTGALIGEITAVKPDATGQNLATIKMGSDVFTVETSKLALKDGTATINASQAELKKMLPPKK